MAIIVLGSSKGGSGKSTLCTNLISLDLAQGSKALLIDGDPQRSSSNWAELRSELGVVPQVVTVEKNGLDIKRTAVEMSQHYDNLFIDVPGNNSPELRASLVVADVLVYPLRPANFDAWVFHTDVTKLIGDARVINPDLKVMLVMNGLSTSPGPRANEVIGLRQYVGEYSGIYLSPSFICSRAGFVQAAKEGRAVHELAKQSESTTKGQVEVAAVYRDIGKVLRGERPEATQDGGAQ